MGLTDIRAQTINDVIERFELSPQMISHHPNGEWIMSSSSEGDSPYLLIWIDDVETTMLLAQHGQDDNSVNGIYVSKKENSRWSPPVKLEGLPYGWSLGFGEEDSVIYLTAETRKIKMIPVPELEERIDDVLSR